MTEFIKLTKKVKLKPTSKKMSEVVSKYDKSVIRVDIPRNVEGVYEIYVSGQNAKIHINIIQEKEGEVIEINGGFENKSNEEILNKLLDMAKIKKMKKQKSKPKEPKNIQFDTPIDMMKKDLKPYKLDEKIVLKPIENKALINPMSRDYVTYSLEQFTCKRKLDDFANGDFDCFEVLGQENKKQLEVYMFDERWEYYNPDLYFLVKEDKRDLFEEVFDAYLKKEPLPYCPPADIARMLCTMCHGRGCVDCAL